MNDKKKALITIVFLSVISAAMAPLTKVALFDFSPITFAFMRFFIASVLILPFLVQKKISLKKSVLPLIPFSLFASGNIIFFVIGIHTTTANISQVLYAGVPIITAFLAHFYFEEKLTTQKTIGIFLGCIGVLFVALLPVFQEQQKFSGDLKGNVFLLLAVLCWAIYILLSKKAQQKYSPFLIISVFIVTTAVVLFPLFIFEALSRQLVFHSSLPSVSSLLYVVFFGTLGTYLLNQYAIRHGGAVFASLALYLSPISGFVFAYLLLGETLSSPLLIGAVLTIVGVYLATKS